MSWTIRPAVLADHGRIVDVVDGWWGRPLSGHLPSLFLENFSSSSLVADAPDGGLLGFLVGFVSGDDPQVAYVHFVGVDPNTRGAGLGRALYDRFIDQVSPLGVRRVRCVTSVVNQASVAFHQAIGFDVVGRRGDAVIDGGEYVEMEREIDAYDGAPQPTASWPPADRLVGTHVELTQTSTDDADALFAALDDAAVWRHLTVPRPATALKMHEVVVAACAAMVPWTVRLRRPVPGGEAGDVVGWTSFLDVSVPDSRLEVGSTSYARPVWGSLVNPECKLLLLGHAFDDLGFGRVQLKTDIKNWRSQDAIARLGAAREGVLRRYQRRVDGTVRHTVMYSITSEEWPTVRAGLLERLSESG